MDNLSQLIPAVLNDHVSAVEFPARLQAHGEQKAEAIARYGAFIGSEIRIYPSLGRAMDQARAHIAGCEQNGRSVASGSLILASRLDSSKGRFQRSWHAPLGGLWGCLLLADTFLPTFRNILPLIPGIACCEALRQEGVPDATIRWVNDVLVNRKKQAGFLVEGFVSPIHHEQYHLLGFGLNVNNEAFPVELQEDATSLSTILGESVDLCSFAMSFFAKIRWYIGLLFYEEAQWLERGGHGEYTDNHPILTRWLELSDTIGQRVSFGYDVVQNPQYEALVTGVTNDGGLILEHDDGGVSIEHSGEVRY